MIFMDSNPFSLNHSKFFVENESNKKFSDVYNDQINLWDEGYKLLDFEQKKTYRKEIQSICTSIESLHRNEYFLDYYKELVKLDLKKINLIFLSIGILVLIEFLLSNFFSISSLLIYSTVLIVFSLFSGVYFLNVIAGSNIKKVHLIQNELSLRRELDSNCYLESMGSDRDSSYVLVINYFKLFEGEVYKDKKECYQLLYLIWMMTIEINLISSLLEGGNFKDFLDRKYDVKLKVYSLPNLM